MPRSSRTSEPPANLRQQLEISAALAREKLIEVHFRHAMELVEHAADDLEPARALAIYARLHGLGTVDADDLHHRIFVALGRKRSRKRTGRTESDEIQAPETPRSILATIRRRLRGRVNLELREWVELHTGRAETELLWTHVENALQFIELLDSTADPGEAVAAYASALAVPDPRAEIIYYLALAHLSTEPLTEGADKDAASLVFADRNRAAIRIPLNRTHSRPPIGAMNRSLEPSFRKD